MGRNVINGGALMYLERMTVEQADGLHRMYGVEFEMNDGHLVGVKGTGLIGGMDFGGAGADRSVLYPAAL